jgi:hypothetical protein
MTHTPATPRKPGRSRRWVRQDGFPHLAAQLPKDFRSPTTVNAFIYSLTAEVTAGRVDSRTAAILGYLSQLAIQTLPLLRIESEPEGGAPVFYQYVTRTPRPDHSEQPATLDAAPATTGIAENETNTTRGETQPWLKLVRSKVEGPLR